MATPLKDDEATQPGEGTRGKLLHTFATPVARVTHPFAAALNEPLAELLLARLSGTDNKFTYKAETSADMTAWGEPLIDSLTTWVLQAARRFVETSVGKSLDEAFADAVANDQETFNGIRTTTAKRVSLVPGRSWASIYRKGDHHEAHFHPNTAIAAIYYVEAPGTCDLDLIDPRANIDYFDPGITFAGEGRNFRLRCTPGELVLFPGWLKHAVPEFHDDAVRISMSWNLSYNIVSTGSSQPAAGADREPASA